MAGTDWIAGISLTPEESALAIAGGLATFFLPGGGFGILGHVAADLPTEGITRLGVRELDNLGGAAARDAERFACRTSEATGVGASPAATGTPLETAPTSQAVPARGRTARP
jgi:hypothetical protein